MRSAIEVFALPLEAVALEISQRLIASEALWHPLGFVSATLLKDESGTLKLHFWPKGDRRSKTPDWPIHDHAFHISSRVLVGTVGSVRYEVASGSTHRRYSVVYSDSDSKLKPTEHLVSCREAGRAIMQAGTKYELPIGTYHENIVPAAELALTLVLKSSALYTSPNVVGTIAIPDLPLYRRSPYSIEDMLTVIDKISR